VRNNPLHVNKKEKKEQTQKQLGLPVNGRIPMVFVSDIDQHILAILAKIIDGVASIGIQLILESSEDDENRPQLNEWQKRFPDSIKVVSKDELDAEAVDIALLEELTVERLKELRENQMVPVAVKGTVVTFNPVEEKGNGFAFESGNPWSLLVALVRAAETYRFPYDWQNLVRAIKNEK